MPADPRGRPAWRVDKLSIRPEDGIKEWYQRAQIRADRGGGGGPAGVFRLQVVLCWEWTLSRTSPEVGSVAGSEIGGEPVGWARAGRRLLGELVTGQASFPGRQAADTRGMGNSRRRPDDTHARDVHPSGAAAGPGWVHSGEETEQCGDAWEQGMGA